MKPVDSNNKKYGGIFKINFQENPVETLSPLESDLYSSLYAINLSYETLLQYKDNSDSLVSLLAKKWKRNETGDEYTFYLHENIFFHNDDCFKDGVGREMTSKDVAYCFTKLCVPSGHNHFADLISPFIVGGKETYLHHIDQNSGEYLDPKMDAFLEGIEIIDDYTLKIKLTTPNYTFPHLLTHYATSIYPHEALDHYMGSWNEHIVGTGPFRLKLNAQGRMLIYTRNNNYWQEDEEKNPLPYLDGIKLSFDQSESDVKEAVKSNMLDLVFNISDTLLPIFQSSDYYEILSVPNWSVYFYDINTYDTLFNNTKVRQAINLAIDRNKISTINDRESDIIHYGMIPDYFDGISREKGYEYNPQKALQLMQEAGYDSDHPFPKFTIQTTDSDNSILIGQSIQKMLTNNLHIRCDLSSHSSIQHYQKYLQGDFLLSEVQWQVDYRSPHNFLTTLAHHRIYTPSSTNASPNVDAEFTNLCKLGFQEHNNEKRMEYFSKANKLIQDNAWIIPLFSSNQKYVMSTRLVNKPKVINSRIMLSHTYIKK